MTKAAPSKNRLSARRSKPGRHVVHMPDYPLLCDFSCPNADFAPGEAVGACRREQAVFCTLFRRFNNKHSACLGRKQ